MTTADSSCPGLAIYRRTGRNGSVRPHDAYDSIGLSRRLRTALSLGGASNCAEPGGRYFPPRGFPPAARTLEGKPAGGHLDPRFMAGDTAQQLFENMAARLTNVFGPDSGPAEDDPDFHMPAHICTGSIDNRHWIEQSIDQKRLHAPAQTGLSGENLPNNRTCTDLIAGAPLASANVYVAAVSRANGPGRGAFVLRPSQSRMRGLLHSE